jgi:hypothetical protein
MSKRKLDEFLELAKDLSAGDIAESLKALGPRKYRRIVSDPRVNSCITLQAGIANYNLTVSPGHERLASTNNSSIIHSIQVFPHPTNMGYQHPRRRKRTMG